MEHRRGSSEVEHEQCCCGILHLVGPGARQELERYIDERRGEGANEDLGGYAISEELLARVDHALRHLDDRIELNRNPLNRLARVEALARSRYASFVHPRAVALRDVLDVTVQAVLSELENESDLRQVREFLALYRSGATVTKASRTLGLSREHCSRTIKKKAIALVAEKFTQLTMRRRPVAFPAVAPPP